MDGGGAVERDLPLYDDKTWCWNAARWKQYGEQPLRSMWLSEGDMEGDWWQDMILDCGLMVTEWRAITDVDGASNGDAEYDR